MKKVGKLVYSPSYGGGIYSWGYKKISCYMPLINWIEKYNEENKDKKLLQKILKNLEIIEVKKELKKEYIILDSKNWIKKIINLNVDKINDKKSKEIILILKKMYKRNLLDEYVMGVLIQKLEIEDIYQDEEMYIQSYDGYETIEYNHCSDAEQLDYNEIILLNEMSLNE